MEIYDCFLNWLANYAIVISTSISLFLTILTCLFNIKSEIQWKIVFYTTILTIILSVPYYIVPFYFPYVLLPFFGILFAIYLNNKKNKSNIKVYSTIIYLINSLTYAIAIELAKVPFNTWGSGTIYVGVYLIALCLPLFHLLKFSYNQDSLYGYIKLTTGLILLLIILITNFPPEYDFRDSNETLNLIRHSIIYSIIIFTTEGCIMIVKEKIVQVFKLKNN